MLSDQTHGPDDRVVSLLMAEDADKAADAGGDAHGPPHDNSEPVPVTIVPDTEVNK